MFTFNKYYLISFFIKAISETKSLYSPSLATEQVLLPSVLMGPVLSVPESPPHKFSLPVSEDEKRKDRIYVDPWQPELDT